MATSLFDASLPLSAAVQCSHCQGKLPLRMSRQGERGAVWLCADCSVPFVSICVKDQLYLNGHAVMLDERYFNTEGLPPISRTVRKEVARLAARAEAALVKNQRRSPRVNQSLVVPAVKLDGSLNPYGPTFQVMIANISREGVGMVHGESIESEYIALKLTLDHEEPIQVVAHLVRERELNAKLREYGGEFFVRLGSVAGEAEQSVQPE